VISLPLALNGSPPAPAFSIFVMPPSRGEFKSYGDDATQRRRQGPVFFQKLK
jgi:hypothetical protein